MDSDDSVGMWRDEKMKRKLPKEDRKEEILKAAQKVFLEKGFSKTTMEDVIAQTTLSKGGVYYHYKNTKEMMFDIFIAGNDYRIGVMKQYIEENQWTVNDLQDEDIAAEIITEKVLAQNPLMGIYAQFVIEAMYNEELYEIYRQIVRKSREDLMKLSPKPIRETTEKDREFEFFTYLINTFIIGSNILKANENFNEHRPLIKEMIKTAIRYFRK